MRPGLSVPAAGWWDELQAVELAVRGVVLGRRQRDRTARRQRSAELHTDTSRRRARLAVHLRVRGRTSRFERVPRVVLRPVKTPSGSVTVACMKPIALLLMVVACSVSPAAPPPTPQAPSVAQAAAPTAVGSGSAASSPAPHTTEPRNFAVEDVQVIDKKLECRSQYTDSGERHTHSCILPDKQMSCVTNDIMIGLVCGPLMVQQQPANSAPDAKADAKPAAAKQPPAKPPGSH
jgi:hypothetical protein